MGSLTFLNYTNRVLQDLNETTVTALSATRGVQTVAKNSINRAINDIANPEVEWPFLHVDHSQQTQAGVAEYSLQSNNKGRQKSMRNGWQSDDTDNPISIDQYAIKVQAVKKSVIDEYNRYATNS